MYEILFEQNVEEELAAIRPFDGRRIFDAIRRQLTHAPTIPTRNRKIVEGARPSFRFDPPLWELRVGAYRVFYDINDAERKVNVRAIRHQPPYKTMEDIL